MASISHLLPRKRHASSERSNSSSRSKRRHLRLCRLITFSLNGVPFGMVTTPVYTPSSPSVIFTPVVRTQVGCRPRSPAIHIAAAFSHRIVGYGDCRRQIRRAYAFGMVMYWVCAGWVSVGYALMVNSKFTRAVCTWLMSPVMRNVASAITLRRLRPPFRISSMTMT